MTQQITSFYLFFHFLKKIGQFAKIRTKTFPLNLYNLVVITIMLFFIVSCGGPIIFLLVLDMHNA
jgi:hypothetical protein